MKNVFSGMNIGEAGLIQSLLEGANILFEVRNEALSTTEGCPFAPEIWVRDEDYEEAHALVLDSRAS